MLVRLLAAAVTALALAASAHAQQPQPPTNFEDPAIEITDLFTLNVAVPTAEQPLYESLFLQPLKPVGPAADAGQPQRPLIDFEIHSVNGNGDGTGGTYENWVNLRGSYCGQFGWYNRATAVDSLALYVVSRGSGYPKIIADSIKIAKTPQGWKATTTQAGKPLVTLEWRKDDARLNELVAKQPFYREWIKGHGHAYDAPIWTFEPYPNSGPYVKWILTRPDPQTPQKWDSRAGVVRVTIAQDANPALTEGNWMGLVPKTIEVPGMVEHYQGKGDFVAHRDDCPDPAAPPPPNGGPGPGAGTGQPQPQQQPAAPARCLRSRARVRRRSIGPARLAWTGRRLVKRLGKPTGRKGRSLGWCLRGGGTLLASLDRRRHVRALATTRVPKRMRGAHRRHTRRIAKRLYRAPRRVYGVSHGRVSFVLIADRHTLASARTLRRVVRRLGL